MSLFVRKPIKALLNESAETGVHTLKRTLGAGGLIALGIGAIIGAGLFSITGMAAANHAGPAITISFVVAALGCLFAGLCYAEFASMIPVAGSAYTYSYATMGEFVAWIIGWDLVLEYAVGAATVGISWSRYLVRFLEGFDVHLPVSLTLGPWDGGIVNLPAVFIIVLMSLLLIKGTKESAFVNGFIVALKVAVVLIFIFLGWKYINNDNYNPYIPDNSGTFGEFGFSGIIRAAAIVFFAYIGFDAVSTAAQEAGIDLSIGEQLIMGLTLMLTSKGVAGVPRASLVILLGTAASFGLPLWPIMAILGIDELMDMARTSVNVIGNTLASCVIARWEGEFDDRKALNYHNQEMEELVPHVK